MMRESVKDFYKYLKEDENVKKELEENLKKYTFSDMKAEDQEAIILRETEKIAKKYNFDVTKDDLANYLKEVGKELTEEDLLNVAGGMSTAGIAGGLLILTGISIGSGAVMNVMRSGNAVSSAGNDTAIVQDVGGDNDGSSTNLNFAPNRETSDRKVDFTGNNNVSGLRQETISREKEQGPAKTTKASKENIKTNVAKPSPWQRIKNFFGIKNNKALSQEKDEANKEDKKAETKTEDNKREEQKRNEEEKKKEENNDQKNKGQEKQDNKEDEGKQKNEKEKEKQEKEKLKSDISGRITGINGVIAALKGTWDETNKDIVEQNIENLKAELGKNANYKLEMDDTTGEVTIGEGERKEIIGNVNIAEFNALKQQNSNGGNGGQNNNNKNDNGGKNNGQDKKNDGQDEDNDGQKTDEAIKKEIEKAAEDYKNAGKSSKAKKRLELEKLVKKYADKGYSLEKDESGGIIEVKLNDGTFIKCQKG